MSKYAVLSLSEALEHELEGTYVGVTALCPGPIATNIVRGAHNRPDDLAGPQRPTDEAVLAERLGMDWHRPQAGRRRVVDAIRSKTFYAFVSAVPADVIKRGTAASRRSSRPGGRCRTSSPSRRPTLPGGSG